MSALLTLSVRAYSAMLFLYPAELRRDFGAEILDVFREDLTTASSCRGPAGMLSVWTCALREFVRIALPAYAENRRVAVPSILFALNEAILTIPQQMIFTHRRISLQIILATALWPSLLAALTALVVVILGQQCPLFPLRLRPDSCSKSAI